MKSLLLVGAGHVHIALLAQAERLRAAGFELYLIDPGSFWYGGARAAVLDGRLGRASLRLPLRAFCRQRGVAYHADRAIGIDLRHRRLWLASGAMRTFDTVSHDVGFESRIDIDSDSHHAPTLWPGTDVPALIQFAHTVAEAQRRQQPLRIAVVGDGARAVETVAGLAASRFAATLQVSWFLPGACACPGAPRAHDRWILRHLVGRGVDVVANTPIVGKIRGAICGRDSQRFAVDHAVFAGAADAAHFVHAGGLPASAQGLHVNRRLQSPRDERVYAAGGCARLPGRREHDYLSVAQQARVLAHNIEAGARRRPFKSCRSRPGGPIIALGNGNAIVWRRRLWWRGKMPSRSLAEHDARWLSLVARHGGHDRS